VGGRRTAKKTWGIGCHAAAALVYAVVAGALMFWPALQEHLPLIWFCTGAVGLNVAGAVLQLIDKQLGDG